MATIIVGHGCELLTAVCVEDTTCRKSARNTFAQLQPVTCVKDFCYWFTHGLSKSEPIGYFPLTYYCAQINLLSADKLLNLPYPVIRSSMTMRTPCHTVLFISFATMTQRYFMDQLKAPEVWQLMTVRTDLFSPFIHGQFSYELSL